MDEQIQVKQIQKMVWVTLVAIYLIFISVFLLSVIYGLIAADATQEIQKPPIKLSDEQFKVWQEKQASEPPKYTYKPHFLLLKAQVSMSEESRMWVLVLAASALGGALHALRSMYWYIGNRALNISWLFKYLMQPFAGAILGIGFYHLLRGGFLVVGGQAQSFKPDIYGFPGFAFLVGLFSEQATLKLKSLADNLFVKPGAGIDSLPQDSRVPSEPDFTITVSPETYQATPTDETVQFKVKIQGLMGFVSPVALKVEGLPDYAKYDLLPSSVDATAAGVNVIVTIDTTSLEPETYSIKFTGVSGTKTHSVSAQLIVVPQSPPTT